MRVGINPTKIDPDVIVKSYHRIVIPVYIPNLEGYFEKSVEVLKLCLTSLENTIHEKTAITVIDNACCEEAKLVIEEYKKRGVIDQLIENKENLGKINSLVPVLKGAWEPLITISDSDVLFVSGWMQAIEKGFIQNRYLGMLSPCPTPYSWTYENQTTLLHGIMTNKFSVINKIDKKDLFLFPQSIGQPDLYDKKAPSLIRKQLVYHTKVIDYIVGAGHFVATLHRDVMPFIPEHSAKSKMRGGTMRDYIDLPVEKAGLFRLATDKIYAHHIGNIPEIWMNELLERDKFNRETDVLSEIDFFKRKKSVYSVLPYSARRILGKGAKYLIKKRYKI